MTRKNDTKPKRPDASEKERQIDRKTRIIKLFREFPDSKFSLKHLASASGGATKEGRRETGRIVEELLSEGIAEAAGREKFRLSARHLPRSSGTADITPSGSISVRVA